MVAGNPRLAEAFAADRRASITDSFTAAAASYVGLCAAGFAVSSVLRVRGEEGSGRLELLLATPLGRRRFLGSGLGVTAAACALLLAAAGLGSGVAAAVVSGHPGAVGTGLAATLVQLPAVLVVAAAVAALVGISTRLAPLGWLLLVWTVLVGLFGPLLGLPHSVTRLTPFGWVPAVPAVPLDVVPLAVLLLVAVTLAGTALAAFRRRDVAP
jgi:ABC-2 type transport system permease protein